MKNDLLTCKVTCKAGIEPVYDGKDIELEITLTNVSREEIGFPLEYVQKAGPLVQVIDRQTRKEQPLRRNLADHALREKLTAIAPGKSLVVRWVVTAHELELYGGNPVDAIIEVSVVTKVKAGDAMADLNCSGTLSIAAKGDS